MSRQILYAKPSITQREIDYVTDAIATGWGERCYDYLVRFRQAFAEYLGSQHVFPTASCTGALHLGLAALGVGPGDEVIVPDLTWIASVAPVTYVGATPVFVDALRDTWCIDPAAVEAAITPRTKAILVVHLYGNLVDLDAVLTIARRHGLPVIEDAAEALGSEYQGRKAGSIADLGVFSFHGTKTMTTGEGGALVTNRDDLAAAIAVLDAHGRNSKEKRAFWCERIGLKYKMSNLQAALGLAQVERLDELVGKRREVFGWYREALGDVPDLDWNPEPAGTINSFWMPTFILGQRWAHVDRDALLAAFQAAGIAARPAFYPLTSLPPFAADCHHPNSRELGTRGVNLPSYFDLLPEDIAYVADQVAEVLA